MKNHNNSTPDGDDENRKRKADAARKCIERAMRSLLGLTPRDLWLTDKEHDALLERMRKEGGLEAKSSATRLKAMRDLSPLILAASEPVIDLPNVTPAATPTPVAPLALPAPTPKKAKAKPKAPKTNKAKTASPSETKTAPTEKPPATPEEPPTDQLSLF